MKKLVKVLILLFGFIAFSAGTSSDDFLLRLSIKLDSFNKLRPKEYFYFALNQDKYAALDTIFFSAYYLNSNKSPTQGKRIFTIALINLKGELVHKINFSIQDGRANNQLILPEKVKPGLYNLLLLNLESAHETSILFSKKISVVSKTKFLVNESRSKEVKFYFEGGNFVNGVINRIIIRSDFKGKGKIKDEKNQEIAEFVVDQNGLASVTFIPVEGSQYFAEIDGNLDQHHIKKAEGDGYSLLISKGSEPKTHKISISIPTGSNLYKQEAYLVVSNGRKIVYSSPITFSKDTNFTVFISDENIANDITQIVILDKGANILAERKIFISNPKIDVNIETLKKEYSQREKIDLELSLRDNFGNPAQGYFSVSIVHDNISISNKSWTMMEEIILNEFFQTNTNELISFTGDREFLINDFLITKNWSPIPWNEIINDKETSNISTENNLSLRGRAIFKNSLKSVPDSTLIVGYLQKEMIGYEARTTKNGLFKMPFLFDFWGDEEVFYLIEIKGKEPSEPYLIIPDSSHSIKYNPSTIIYSSTDTLDDYGDYSFKKKIVDQSFGFFSNQKKSKSSISLNKLFEEEAMGSDLTVKIQDYIQFPTMEDLIREVVPFLEYRKKGNKNSIRMLLNRKTNYIRSKSEPVFLIDGVLSKNRDFFLSLKPADVITIKIINDGNKLSHLGILGKNGIVLVETKRSLATKVEENSTVIKIKGLSKPIPFFIKDHSKNTNSRLPDLRSTLYWSPSNSFNMFGKSILSFYSSDDLGKMKIIVKGMTNKGEPFETENYFNVTNSK